MNAVEKNITVYFIISVKNETVSSFLICVRRLKMGCRIPMQPLS